MNQIRLFQVLIIGNWLLQLLLHLLPVSSWYADPMIEKLMTLDGYGAVVNWDSAFLNQIPIFGFLMASVGMLFFRNWARYMYLIIWSYGWIATLLFGFRVSVPVQGFVGMTIGTIDGAILGLSFLSTLRHQFKNDSY